MRKTINRAQSRVMDLFAFFDTKDKRFSQLPQGERNYGQLKKIQMKINGKLSRSSSISSRQRSCKMNRHKTN